MEKIYISKKMQPKHKNLNTLPHSQLYIFIKTLLAQQDSIQLSNVIQFIPQNILPESPIKNISPSLLFQSVKLHSITQNQFAKKSIFTIYLAEEIQRRGSKHQNLELEEIIKTVLWTTQQNSTIQFIYPLMKPQSQSRQWTQIYSISPDPKFGETTFGLQEKQLLVITKSPPTFCCIHKPIFF